MLASLCLITRNEERFLNECLASAAPVVDEIVVVDTGSSDRTSEIAQRYTRLVHSIEFLDDFSEARNAALDLVHGTWVMFLDADERLESDEAARIRRALSAAGPDVLGLRMFRYDFYSTGGWFCGPRLRIFRNDLRIRYRGKIHDEVASAIAEAGGTVTDVPVLLDHFGHCRPHAERQTKSRWYLTILDDSLRDDPQDGVRRALRALQLRNLRRLREANEESDLATSLKPQSPMVRKYRGHVLRSTGDLDGARESYAAGLELVPADDRWERACFRGLIAVVEMMSGNVAEAARELDEAISIAPRLPHLLIGTGLLHEARGDFDSALRLYERAAAMHPPFLLEWPLGWLTEPAFTALEYDTVPHYLGLRRHIDVCRIRAGQHGVPHA